MDFPYTFNMIEKGDVTTQCAVYDKTPNSEQQRINIIVRPTNTVAKVISDIKTQYRYETFDLLLQPETKDLVYLNDHLSSLIYNVPGFEKTTKNILILLPTGEWDGNRKKRYDLTLTSLPSISDFYPINSSPEGNMAKIVKRNSITTHNNNNNNNFNGLNDTFSPHSVMSANMTHNSRSDSLNVSPMSEPDQDQLLYDDLVLGASASPIERGPLNSSELVLPHTSTSTSNINTCSAVGEKWFERGNMSCAQNKLNSLNLSPMSESDQDQMSDDDLALGASASPTESEPMNSLGLALAHTSPSSSHAISFDVDYMATSNMDSAEKNVSSFLERKYPLSAVNSTATITGISFVGLVNQAMTCYLNSLLQALYMTPEFRNALYRWEFDNDNEAKNIPYQLQKLFLNLQTSKKPAVETTDLTRSFGWDSTEAWQQHDIQELCRVMFDALEHKFKNTKQANLISNLYEGKMIDYVKCLECNTEKTRADTFLDIPLPVRPFGSNVAYGSIEEALRAFVQPEILDGNNQYFCEKCNKKCDAHKGLKFKNFPYVLTLHLKRFDFDYQTMHRIKLNDKVTFPQSLNLNSFVNVKEDHAFVSTHSNVASNLALATANGYIINGVNATDDCSTTDSGSAMEEDNCSSGIATTACSSQHENDMNDDDEGIDMSTSTGVNAEHRSRHESGPYLYELFAIMIHSGSASGGHYYAYIKEFENNDWYSFNDQTVSAITEEDIQKSFGGSATKSYYSSIYSSSTNAYMLMYRQMDRNRNESAMKVQDFPEHINQLLKKLQMEEESNTSIRRIGRHNAMPDLALPEHIKPRVYFYNPNQKKLKVTRVSASRSFDLSALLENAYKMLNVDEFAPLSHCRLVGYDQSSEEILQSFENVEDKSLTDIRAAHEGTYDFLLEYRADDQELEVYEPTGNTWYVYVTNSTFKEMDGPYFVHSPAHENNARLRRSIAKRFNLNENSLIVATLVGKKAFVIYDSNPTKEAQEYLQSVAKSQFRHIIYFYLNIPSTDPKSLEILGIPSVESQTPTIEVSSDVVDAVPMNAATYVGAMGDNLYNLGTNDYLRREPALPPQTLTGLTGQESNSEDSSLSDGDRTLVESIQNRCGGDSQISSCSHSPQLSSPEDEMNSESMKRVAAYFSKFLPPQSEMDTSSSYNTPSFFSAIKIDSPDAVSSNYPHCDADSSEDLSRKPTQAYKILANSHMKISVFKKYIENLIRVPINYFRFQRKHDSSDAFNTAHSLLVLNEAETVYIELGKTLEADEQKAKISFMRLSELNNETVKLPCVCEWVYNTTTTVTEAKKELISKLHRIDDKYLSLNMDNCRLWLKGGRNPVKILEDTEPLVGDLRSKIESEFLVQECENGISPQPHEVSLTLFVRRWYPAKMELGKFEEITLNKDDELRETLSKLSGIETDHISYCKVNSSFPCTNISLVSINTNMSWTSIPVTIDKYPLSATVSGNIYFYKDAMEETKELSSEERFELCAKEKHRLDRMGCISSTTSSYSPRRERALKIYLDSPKTTTTSSTNTTTTDRLDY
ncbi:ubiquitin carboxyl-terminal hydrolase 47 isoform X2 [Teleopsis dalmanni]|uniref:ubiquitin carboxyl-terminal hydrolase 47 isoform X2 n=4 Tax=Teleopsis dalmanni TaxID=139649 RepID=UPI0018CC8DEF|nr:ubiquitin carboxyl-terminal hydrolase 47 isoform X2 [Teleopsis dalmanni]